jgi:hypothetical protein
MTLVGVEPDALPCCSRGLLDQSVYHNDFTSSHTVNPTIISNLFGRLLLDVYCFPGWVMTIYSLYFIISVLLSQSSPPAHPHWLVFSACSFLGCELWPELLYSVDPKHPRLLNLDVQLAPWKPSMASMQSLQTAECGTPRDRLDRC